MDKKQGGGVVAAFFAKPTIAKAAPAYGVTAAEFCGFSLNDVLIMLTIIYTLLLLFNRSGRTTGRKTEKEIPGRVAALSGMERIITET